VSAVPTKRARVIRALLNHEKINRFELERVASDHCPPSTIAELRSDGLEIATDPDVLLRMVRAAQESYG